MTSSSISANCATRFARWRERAGTGVVGPTANLNACILLTVTKSNHDACPSLVRFTRTSAFAATFCRRAGGCPTIASCDYCSRSNALTIEQIELYADVADAAAHPMGER